MTITRRQAWTCFLVNQLACPGIGTIMAGKRIGYLQAALMIAGFCMALGYGLLTISAIYSFAMDATATEAKWKAMQPPGWVGIMGFGLCGLAWFWSLFSSLRILREARRRENERKPPPLFPSDPERAPKADEGFIEPGSHTP